MKTAPTSATTISYGETWTTKVLLIAKESAKMKDKASSLRSLPRKRRQQL